MRSAAGLIACLALYPSSTAGGQAKGPSPSPGTDTVTCVVTVDNFMDQLWISDLATGDTAELAGALKAAGDTCLQNWQTGCEFVFKDTTAWGVQVMGIAGYNAEDKADGQYCGPSGAGIAFYCESTDPDSPWNQVYSNVADTQMEAFSVPSIAAAPLGNWYVYAAYTNGTSSNGTVHSLCVFISGAFCLPHFPLYLQLLAAAPCTDAGNIFSLLS